MAPLVASAEGRQDDEQQQLPPAPTPLPIRTGPVCPCTPVIFSREPDATTQRNKRNAINRINSMSSKKIFTPEEFAQRIRNITTDLLGVAADLDRKSTRL